MKMTKKRAVKKSKGKQNLLIFIAILVFAMFVSPEIYDFANNSDDPLKSGKQLTETLSKEIKNLNKSNKNDVVKSEKSSNESRSTANNDKQNKTSKTGENNKTNANTSNKTNANDANESNANKNSKENKTAESSEPAKRYKDIEIPTIVDKSMFYYNEDGRFYIQYNEDHKIPLYVSYILTREEATENVVDRSTSFKSDNYFKKLGFELATNGDYTRSGYDRGHMLPSADRNDTKEENKATFLFSNITPQSPTLNREVLSVLERDIRALAIKYDSIYIVTGSILQDNPDRPINKIGKGVSIPQYIYKVVAYIDNNRYKTIGFLLPNNSSIDSDYKKYAVSVDDIEKLSKLDFFHLLPDSTEDKCEAIFDLKSFSAD